jgi:hypothetical protein
MLLSTRKEKPGKPGFIFIAAPLQVASGEFDEQCF